MSVARALLATSLMLIASSMSACDEPNEPNAIQPADFERSGEGSARPGVQSDALGTTEIAPLPGDDADGEPALATPRDAQEAPGSITDDLPAIER